MLFYAEKTAGPARNAVFVCTLLLFVPKTTKNLFQSAFRIFFRSYLYVTIRCKVILSDGALLWNTTIGMKAGCSRPGSTRHWCGRNASWNWSRCASPIPCGCCPTTIAVKTNTSVCAATGGNFLRPESGRAVPCCSPSVPLPTTPLCSATGGGCSTTAAATLPLRWT